MYGCSEYLDRICFYRKRCWTCKVTGKINLTFEEALMSERMAMEKVQQFPSNLVAPVLREVQFSTTFYNSFYMLSLWWFINSALVCLVYVWCWATFSIWVFFDMLDHVKDSLDEWFVILRGVFDLNWILITVSFRVINVN